MATAKSAGNPNEDWKKNWDEWFQGQRALFDQQLKNSSDLQEQWSSFFKEWQGTMTPSLAGAEVYQKFFAQSGKQFLEMLEQFYTSTGQNKSPSDISSEWLNSMNTFFLTMLQTNTQPANIAESYKAMADGLFRGGNAWASAFTGSGFNPAAGFGGFGGFGGFNPAQAGFNPAGWTSPQWNPQAGFQSFQNFDPFGFYASLPGIGYTREKQESWNLLYKLWTEFEGEVKKYNAAMAQVGIEAVHKFQEYLAAPPADAPPLQSLKEIYGKWVDVCEDVYAKYATSEEYTRLYGEVVNALMAVKGQANELIDDVAVQFNLPTRKEVDSLHQRMHDLRRDNLELRKAINELRGAKGEKKAEKQDKAAPAAASKPVQKESSKKGGK